MASIRTASSTARTPGTWSDTATSARSCAPSVSTASPTPIGSTAGSPPPDFDLAEFLKHSWGIYHGRTVYDVVIHFDAALAALLEESTHHPDQRVARLGNGDLEYRVSLSHLEKVARWIVGFAGAARAVEPPALVDLVSDMAARAHEAHRRGDAPAPAGGQRDLPHVDPEGGASPRQRSLI